MRLDHLLSMENVVKVKRHFTVFDERIPVEKNCCSIFRDRKRTEKKLVLQTQRVHPYPFRTRKLSSAVLTILHRRRCGKIGQGQHRSRFARAERFLQFPTLWGCSSAGRAPALQAGGHGFESHHLHQRIKPQSKWKKPKPYRLIAQQVRARA